MVTQDFPPDRGGTQTYALEIARGLAARVEELVVAAPRVPGCEEVDARLPFRVVRLPGDHNTVALTSLWPLLRYRHFDLTFHVQWQAALGAWLLGLGGLSRPMYVAAHGRELVMDFPWPLPGARKIFRWLRRRVLHRAEKVFAVSTPTAELARKLGLPQERVQVVPNGTDFQRFHPARREVRSAGKKLLTVCRLVPHKGIDTVIEALPRLRESIPEVHYQIGGEGPDRPRLEALARRLGVEDRVEFLGRVPDSELVELYNSCDLFVLATRPEPPNIEGFGLVFLEAGACEKPVVGTRVGGVIDAVADGETGILVPPSDPKALASALLELLHDPARAHRLGVQSRQRILKHFTWAHSVEQLFRTVAGKSQVSVNP